MRVPHRRGSGHQDLSAEEIGSDEDETHHRMVEHPPSFGVRGLGAAQVNTEKKPPFIHPQALCESTDVGAGTRVWAFAHVMKGARVGEDCNLCDHSFIESGAVLGNRVTVKNAVLVWDKVTVEDEV